MNKDILYRFFNNELSVTEEKQVLAWIKISPQNMEEFLRERKFYNSVILLDDNRCTKQQPEKTAARTRRRIARSVFRYAAIIAVMLGVSFYFIHSERKEMLAAANTITVPVGQRVNITLPDGTNVWINSRSELQYPAYFSGGERRVVLKGEAFFDVKRNEKQPFIVETFAYDVKVLGTQFDVTAMESEDRFSTSLISGSIAVTDKNTGRETPIRPGQRLYGSKGRSYISEIDNMDVFRWREGLICFRNASLTDLIKIFEQYFNTRITLEKNTLPSNTFTGKVRVEDGLDHALRVLKANADFTYHWNENADIVYIR